MTKPATRHLGPVVFPWLVCALGALVYSYEYLLRMSPSVMQESLMRYYHLTGVQYGYLSGSFYYVMYVAMQIVVGLLMDRYGPRRLLTLAGLLCAMGAWLFACSHVLGIAMAGRFLIGFGSAFAFVGATKLATIWLPPERFALVSGIIFCLGMMGAMFGDTILRMLVDLEGWQAAIREVSVAGFLIALLTWMVVRDVNPYAPVIHAHRATHMKEVLAGLWKVLKQRQLWLCGMVGCLLYLFLSAFAEFAAPAWLHQVHHLSRADAATATSLVFLGCAMGAPLWGLVSDYLRLRRLPLVVAAAGALVTFCMLLYVHGLSQGWICVLLFVFGFLSSAQILVFAIARELTSLRSSGTAIGMINMLVMISGVVFPPLLGKLLDLNWTGGLVAGSPIYTAHTYTVAFTALPVGIFIGIVLALCIRETRCQVYYHEADGKQGKADSTDNPDDASFSVSSTQPWSWVKIQSREADRF